MHSQVEKIGVNGRAIIDKTILHNLNTQLDVLGNFLDAYEQIALGYNSKISDLDLKAGLLPLVLETLAFRQNIFDFIEKQKVHFNPSPFDKEFEQFYKEFNEFVETLTEETSEEQYSELFSLKVKRPEGLQVLIFFKRFFWRISNIPLHLSNLAGRMFGKKKKPLRYWKHRIPWKRMTLYHLVYGFGNDIVGVYEQLYKLESQILIALSEIGSQADQEFLKKDFEEVNGANTPEDDNVQLESPTAELGETGTEADEHGVQTIEKIKKAVEEKEKEKEVQPIHVYYRHKLDELRAEIAEFKASLPEKIGHRYETALSAFGKNAIIVGTVELPLFNYRLGRLNARKNLFQRHYQSLRKLWEPTLESIWDTKLYKLEIKMLRYFATKEYFRIEHSYRQRINSNIIGELDKLNKFILDSKNRISSFKGDEQDLRKLLLEEKINVKKVLTNELTPKTVDFILNQDLPNILHQSEQALTRRVRQLADNRSICPDEHKVLPIVKSEKVNLRQMVAFEALPRYTEESKNIRNLIFEDLNKIQGFIIDINQIVDFTLESALAADKNEEEDQETPKKIAEEGLERALRRTGDVHKELHDIFGEVTKNLRGKVLDLNENLTAMLNVADIAQIKMKINKAMTLSRTMEMRKNVATFFLNLVPYSISLFRARIKKTRDWFDGILLKFGLAKSPEVISTEIADFLAATKSAVARLPFVYQRLFKIEPLTDSNFFLPREKEMEEINKAFENWKLGHYAATVVVGERGSGVTTLVNHFLETIKGTRVIKGEVIETVYSAEDFQKFMNDLLDAPDLKNCEDTIKMLNNMNGQCVLVVEDLQHLFLRVVDGFSALDILVEIISKTNTKVFWLMSCTSQAWDYLTKTMRLNEYLAYVIKMHELPNEAIIETISKRHRVSGYDEKFLASEKVKNTKKYKRVPESGQQAYLRNEYFSRLSQFAKSNISLAILYWLRSTQKVEGNTIHIGIDDLDFNFLDALTTQKLIIIYLILLHNGLNESTLARIQNIPVERARLELINLYDDGILEKDGENYEVNMFLYRPLLRLLGKKNIIH